MRSVRPFLILVLSLCLLVLTSLGLAGCGGGDATTTLSSAVIDLPAGTLATTTSTAVIIEEMATTTTSNQPPAVAQVQVPDVIGWWVADAEFEMMELGLECEAEPQPTCLPSSDGLVLAQDPAAGAWVPPGSLVRIQYWKYLIPVPDVVGMTEEDATLAVCGAGFSNVDVTYVTTLVPSKMGKVIEQSPGAGVQVEPGTVVQLKVGWQTPPASM